MLQSPEHMVLLNSSEQPDSPEGPGDPFGIGYQSEHKEVKTPYKSGFPRELLKVIRKFFFKP